MGAGKGWLSRRFGTSAPGAARWLRRGSLSFGLCLWGCPCRGSPMLWLPRPSGHWGVSPISAPYRGWSCPAPTPAVDSLGVPIWIIFPLCSDHLQPSPPLFSSPLSRVSDSPPAKGWSSTVNREQLQAGPAPATRFSLPVPSQGLQSLSHCSPFWGPNATGGCRAATCPHRHPKPRCSRSRAEDGWWVKEGRLQVWLQSCHRAATEVF